MTREHAQKIAPILQAYAEGKEIQNRYEPDGKWSECLFPLWYPNIEYRIKPEPREFWVNIYPNGTLCLHESERLAETGKMTNCAQTIKVREVL